jgi:hypothetical protein
MTGFTRSLVSSALAAVVVLTAGALPALARSGTVSTTGNDISWPQCGGSYPAGQAFGIVGVNHGLANNQNQCLANELSWAATTSTGNGLPTGFPKAALYVNTADPGSVGGVQDWPTDNCDPNQVSKSSCSPTVDPLYGSCAVGSNGAGLNDQACAWQYGWNRAIQDMLYLIATAPSDVSNHPSDYWWWLDVETGNTWESGSSGLANNVADLQGMVAALKNTAETVTGSAGVQLGGVTTVGIYSTSYQWGQITDSSAHASDSDLVGLPDWIPGARTLSGAQANCSLTGFTTTAKPTITQWFGKPYDGDVACP